MEQILSTLPEATTVQALQSMLPALIANWNNPEGFRRAATPQFMRKAGLPRAEAARAVAVVDQALRQVVRLRNTHFRPFENDDALESAYTRIVPSSADSPSMQGSLWLAFQAQKTGVDYLASEEGKAGKADFAKIVNENKTIFQAMKADGEGLSMAKIEKVLVTIGQKFLGERVDNFALATIAGHIIEIARREARGTSKEKALIGQVGRLSEELRMLATVIEPVHMAELNDANNRFVRLNSAEKGRRFDQLRTYLNNRAQNIAKFAPGGFEKFCHAVESQLFPYPAQIEWMRTYLKPMYVNAEQSLIFDNCSSDASIRQRYEKVMSEKTANATLIEMARAFALAKMSRQVDPEQRDLLDQLDLKGEFNWPGSLQEFKAQRKA